MKKWKAKGGKRNHDGPIHQSVITLFHRCVNSEIHLLQISFFCILITFHSIEQFLFLLWSWWNLPKMVPWFTKNTRPMRRHSNDDHCQNVVACCADPTMKELLSTSLAPSTSRPSADGSSHIISTRSFLTDKELVAGQRPATRTALWPASRWTFADLFQDGRLFIIPR